MTTPRTTGKKKGSTADKINSLKKEIKKLKSDLKEKDDKILRSIADFQNYQKRVQKELINREEETKQKYLARITTQKRVLNL